MLQVAAGPARTHHGSAERTHRLVGARFDDLDKKIASQSAPQPPQQVDQTLLDSLTARFLDLEERLEQKLSAKLLPATTGQEETPPE